MPSKFYLQNKRKDIYKRPMTEERKIERQDKKNEFEITDKMKKVSVKDEKNDNEIITKSPIKPLKYKL